MKKLIILFLSLYTLLPVFGLAANDDRGKYGGDPLQILDTVVEEANDEYKIQQTALDQATDKQ
jgi:hypothetical protein